jgi:hypothetical protein
MIPKSLLSDILNDRYYRNCIRYKEGTCRGRITFEHTEIYKGRQIQEKWAIVPLCSYHHAVLEYQDCGDFNKELGQAVALNRATDKELEKYSKTIDYKRRRDYLKQKYAI